MWSGGPMSDLIGAALIVLTIWAVLTLRRTRGGVGTNRVTPGPPPRPPTGVSHRDG